MKRGKSQVKYCHKFYKLTHSQTQTHWNTLHELRNAGRKECFKWNFLGPAKAPSSPPLRLAGFVLRFFARVFHKLLCFTIYYLTINENHRFWVENTTIKTVRRRERGAFFCRAAETAQSRAFLWRNYYDEIRTYRKKKIMAKKKQKKQELFCLLKSTTIIILNCIKKGIKQSEKSFPNTFTNTF